MARSVGTAKQAAIGTAVAPTAFCNAIKYEFIDLDNKQSSYAPIGSYADEGPRAGAVKPGVKITFPLKTEGTEHFWMSFFGDGACTTTDHAGDSENDFVPKTVNEYITITAAGDVAGAQEKLTGGIVEEVSFDIGESGGVIEVSITAHGQSYDLEALAVPTFTTTIAFSGIDSTIKIGAAGASAQDTAMQTLSVSWKRKTVFNTIPGSREPVTAKCEGFEVTGKYTYLYDAATHDEYHLGVAAGTTYQAGLLSREIAVDMDNLVDIGNGSNYQFTFIMRDCILGKRTMSVDGPGQQIATYDFKAYKPIVAANDLLTLGLWSSVDIGAL